MARKKKGYVELYWACPNCKSENLGSVTVCGNCGSPQPDNVEFYQGSHQQLVTDDEKLKQAKAGADIHCAYCNTRNPGDTKTCSQCGSDLSEGAQRASEGRVVGSFKAGTGALVKCPNCASDNAYVNRKCHNCGTPLSHKIKADEEPKAKGAGLKRGSLMVIGAVVLVLCAAIYFLFLRTSDVTGVVRTVGWERSVAIEAFIPVQREAWLDELGADAEILSCSEEVRHVQDAPPASGRYEEVCGTPYNVETGGGFAEVVQDCEYQVYDQYCTYSELDWTPISTVQTVGRDLFPDWPAAALASEERLGEQSESYACIFAAGGEEYIYTTDSFTEFQQCEIGSEWTLSVTSLGAVTSISQ
ncbi:MAG: hypothetical protein DWG76_05760 [Chloroflexi bacterium]|nr:hypothetical protein [Chloroflexota bacterium]